MLALEILIYESKLRFLGLRKPKNNLRYPIFFGQSRIRKSSLMSGKHYNVGMTPDRSISGLIQ